MVKKSIMPFLNGKLQLRKFAYLCGNKPKIVMEIKKIYSVYFSATYTTRKVVRGITAAIGAVEIVECDVTSEPIEKPISMGVGDVLVIGMPVYGGRIPESTLESIAKLNGNGSPAVIACVYGNRDYDDALLELRNEVESRGFNVVSAGAFIARHSIFTQLANDRPNDDDMRQVCEFATHSKVIIETHRDFTQLQPIAIKGNEPYKVFNQLPIFPTANDDCTQCGRCADKCPVGAISKENIRTADAGRCIACGRCIVECQKNARDFRGEFIEARAAKFIEAFSEPRANELMYAQVKG